MEFETEEQKLDALKTWWKKNGTAMIAGIVIGGALIGGWRLYQGSNLDQAEQASILYETVLTAANSATDLSEQQTRVNKMMAEYSATPYAALSALVLSAQQVKSGDNIKAAQQLEWVIKNSSAVEIRTIARLRLARILMASEQYDAAMKLVAAEYPESFSALFEEFKGDLYVARGDVELARIAYDKAILASTVASADRASDYLKIKRNDLGQRQLKEPAL